MENKKHLNQVESLRASAALAVAIFHFSAYFTWNESTAKNFSYGALGVEIFYMISGFIITYSLYHTSYVIRDYFRYMGKRLIRLMPPYLVVILLSLGVNFALCQFLWYCPWSITEHFKQALTNLFFIADLFPQPELGWINPIFATLEVEMHFYIFIGLFFPLFNKYPWIYFITCALLLNFGYETIEIDSGLVRSPYFICGMSIFFIKTKGPNLFYILPVLATIMVLNEFYYPEDLIATLIGIVLLFLLPANFRFLNFTGKISYSYYLIHGLAGGWFLFFTAKSEFATSYPALMIIVALILSWIAAFGMYQLIEKPSMRLSKRIKYLKSK